MSREDLSRVARWFVTGLVTVGVDTGLFALVYRATGSVVAGNAVAFPISTAVNYALQRSWAFRSTRGHRSALLRYGLALLFFYLVNTAIVKVAIVLGSPDITAKIVAAAIQMPVNYLVLRRLVFSPAGAREGLT